MLRVIGDLELLILDETRQGWEWRDGLEEQRNLRSV